MTRQGKLDGAIECHEKASTLLSSAMTLSSLTTVQQSLLCQKEYHTRQVWLLQSKIAQLEKYQKKMNSTGGKIESVSCSVESQQDMHQGLKITQMEIMRYLNFSAIHETMRWMALLCVIILL